MLIIITQQNVKSDNIKYDNIIIFNVEYLFVCDFMISSTNESLHKCFE